MVTTPERRTKPISR